MVNNKDIQNYKPRARGFDKFDVASAREFGESVYTDTGFSLSHVNLSE
jgi:hypothetical protein